MDENENVNVSVTKDVHAKLASNEYKIVDRPNAKSYVWNKFWLVVSTATNSPAGFSMCKLGRCILRYTSSTSNMQRHKCAQIQGDTISIIPDEAKKAAKEACVKMCALDMRPFNTVSGEGFMHLAQTLISLGAKHGNLDAALLLPHRTTVSRATTDLCDRLKLKVLPEVTDAMSEGACAITTDMWTDNYVRNHYTSLTTHYIDREWALKSRALLCAAFPDVAKTGDNIAQEIVERSAELGIPIEHLKKCTFVSDKGANIQKALRDTGFDKIPCVAHCFNTTLRHTFDEKFLRQDAPEMRELLTQCKDSVTYLKRSGLVHQLDNAVLQDVDTRFNSKLLMLSSIDTSFESIGNVLKKEVENLQKAGNKTHPVQKAKETFDKIDVSLLKEVITFLSPFKEACDDLEGDKMVNLHKVLLHHTDLKAHCELKQTDSESMSKIRARCGGYLQEKVEIDMLHKIATFLCPSYSQLVMLSDEEILLIKHTITEMCTTMVSSSEAGSSSSGNANPADNGPQAKRCRFQHFKNVPKVNVRSPIADEMKRYEDLATSDPEEGDDVLGWWKKQQKSFPLLSCLARKVLCIPATSASSERVFSWAGWLLNCRRSDLDPIHVDELVFLRSNLNN